VMQRERKYWYLLTVSVHIRGQDVGSVNNETALVRFVIFWRRGG
jgi:hypothetical protein